MPPDNDRYFDARLDELYERIERLENFRDTESRGFLDRFTAVLTKLATLEERCAWQGATISTIVSVAIATVNHLVKK